MGGVFGRTGDTFDFEGGSTGAGVLQLVGVISHVGVSFLHPQNMICVM